MDVFINTLFVLFALMAVTDEAPVLQTDTECAHKVADVVFALDSSKSIWEEDFIKQLNFVKNLVNEFPISQNGIHVGVVTYGYDIYENFGLQDFHSVSEVTSAINMIQYVGGGTNTGGVIKYARENMFDTENGGRNVDQIMIVITDGYSMNNENTTIEASISKRAGIKMISVGVGHNVDDSELRYIASKEDDRRLMFRVDDFSALDSIQTILAQAACQAIHTDDIMLGDEGYSNRTELDEGTVRKYCGGKPADIYFVVDASSSILPEDFSKMQAFIADTVGSFDLDVNKTRVGVVVYSNDIDPVITIGSENVVDDLKSRIMAIPHLRGGTETGKALNYLRTEGFTKGVARDGVAHIAIILTDGQSADIRQTYEEARLLKQAGIYLYVIGIGRQVDGNELKAISSDPDEDFLYRMESFDALSSIQNILAYKMCGDCGGKPADIYFVVDASSSILPEDFSKMQAFIADTVGSFDLDVNKTRVGVVVYSNDIDPVITIGSENVVDDLKSRIMAIPHLRGGTETGKALNYLRTEGFTKGVARDGVAHIAIILTDGQSADIRQTYEEARLLKQAGIYLYVIGIGRQVDGNELKAISSDPDEDFLYRMESFDALSSIQNILAYKMCGGTVEDETNKEVEIKKCEPFSNLNVVYVYDAFSIGKQNSESLIQLIEEILIRTDSPRVKSGVISHSCDSIKSIPLTNNVHGREQLEGLVTRQSDTLPMILHEVRTKFVNSDYVSGPDALNVIVLFIDGNLENYRRIRMALKRVTFTDTAVVYIVGMGDKLDDEMKDLASVSDNAYFIPIADSMNLERVSELLGQTVCDSDIQLFTLNR